MEQRVSPPLPLTRRLHTTRQALSRVAPLRAVHGTVHRTIARCPLLPQPHVLQASTGTVLLAYLPPKPKRREPTTRQAPSRAAPMRAARGIVRLITVKCQAHPVVIRPPQAVPTRLPPTVPTPPRRLRRPTHLRRPRVIPLRQRKVTRHLRPQPNQRQSRISSVQTATIGTGHTARSPRLQFLNDI